MPILNRSSAWLMMPALVLACATATARADNMLFNVTFDQVDIPQSPGYAAAPTTTVNAGGTTTLPTDTHDGDSATLRVYPSFTDSVTGNTLGGSGDQVLVFNDTATDQSVNVQFGLASSDRPTTGRIVIRFDLMADSVGDDGTNNGIYIALENAAGKSLALFKMLQDKGQVTANEYDADGGNSRGGGNLDASGSFSLGQVIHARIELDLDQGRSYFYLNDVLQSGNASSDATYSTDLPSGVGFGELQVSLTNDSTGRLGLDNVVISVPEPTTAGMALLGLGGLLSGRSRMSPRQ